VRGGGRKSQFNDWRKSLALCLLCAGDLEERNHVLPERAVHGESTQAHRLVFQSSSCNNKKCFGSGFSYSWQAKIFPPKKVKMKTFYCLKSLNVFLREFSFVSGFKKVSGSGSWQAKISPQKGKNEDIFCLKSLNVF
jgi:hypothetical protein